jgi:hypothetical protein
VKSKESLLHRKYKEEEEEVKRVLNKLNELRHKLGDDHPVLSKITEE